MAGESFTLHLNDYFRRAAAGPHARHHALVRIQGRPRARGDAATTAWCRCSSRRSSTSTTRARGATSSGRCRIASLVRRLLNAFPVMSWAQRRRCACTRPSRALPIARTSTVELGAEGRAAARPAPHASSARLALEEMPDSPTRAGTARPPAPSTSARRDACCPRCPRTRGLALQAAPGATDTTVLSFLPTQLQATAEMYAEMLRYCTSYGAYDALILPAAAAHGMERWATRLTTEGHLRRGGAEAGVFPSASPVVDHFLAALLGSPAGFTAHGLAAARAAFFKGGASKLLVEAQSLRRRAHRARLRHHARRRPRAPALPAVARRRHGARRRGDRRAHQGGPRLPQALARVRVLVA